MKTKRLWRWLAVLCLGALLLGLSACSSGLEKQLREKAENYLAGLAAKTWVEDTFRLSSAKADLSAKADPVIFTAHSDKYDKDFILYVSRDGKNVSDSYYTLSFQETAEREMAELLKEVLGNAPFSARVLWNPSPSQEQLSCQTFSTLKQFCNVAGGLGPLVIEIHPLEQEQLSQEQIDRLLLAMQEKGIRGTLYPFASDSVWYELAMNGIWKTLRSGADDGAFLNREEYKPGE